MALIPEDIIAVQREAELLHTDIDVKNALMRMSEIISNKLEGLNPLVLCVMNGGLVPTGWLLPLLHFPLQLDYLHVTRYHGNTRGRDLEWLARPGIPLHERTILLIDDVYDIGMTLSQVVDDCLKHGASSVYTAVLVKKIRMGAGIKPDFVGLEAPDRYLFGCGMDYKNYLRNLPEIYMLPTKYEKQDHEHV
ncbi:MAG: hypoxanthine-guanine phosphoribosyltransferase [Gammaproteobacteria bacterium]|nr:hypoxanthine-guanine phosphoribosyltransferase [Gammaproteobacteria bacterium]